MRALHEEDPGEASGGSSDSQEEEELLSADDGTGRDRAATGAGRSTEHPDRFALEDGRATPASILLLSATKVCSRHQLLPKHLSTQWHGLTMGIKKQKRSLREGFAELQMSCKKWELRWTCKKWSSRWLAPFFRKGSGANA